MGIIAKKKKEIVATLEWICANPNGISYAYASPWWMGLNPMLLGGSVRNLILLPHIATLEAIVAILRSPT